MILDCKDAKKSIIINSISWCLLFSSKDIWFGSLHYIVYFCRPEKNMILYFQLLKITCLIFVLDNKFKSKLSLT